MQLSESALLKAAEERLAQREAQTGISRIQVGRSALRNADKALGRMQELAKAAAAPEVTAEQKATYQKEFAALRGSFDRHATNTTYGGKGLFDGSSGTATRGSADGKTARTAAESGFDDLRTTGGDERSPYAALARLDLTKDAAKASEAVAAARKEVARTDADLGSRRTVHERTLDASRTSGGSRGALVDREFVERQIRQANDALRAQATSSIARSLGLLG